MSIALVCKQCAGMLPAPGGGSSFVSCPFCGTTHTVDATPLSLLPEAERPSDYQLRKEAAVRTWDQARQSSTDPVVWLRAVVAVFSGPLKTEQQLERAARLAQALVVGFDTANQTEAIRDKAAALRIAEAATKAVIELKSCADTDVNLPYFFANASGPIHLSHNVKQAKLAELDLMGVYTVVEATAPVEVPHPPAPPPAEKPAKKWWQF